MVILSAGEESLRPTRFFNCYCSFLNDKTLLFDFAKHIPELVKIYQERQCRGLIFTLPCQPLSLAGGQHLGDYETQLFLSALELCQGSHAGVAGRNDWDKPVHTIIQGSDSLCGDWTLHPGNIQPDGTYDNAKYFSVAEIFALSGVDKRYTDAISPWARKNTNI